MMIGMIGLRDSVGLPRPFFSSLTRRQSRSRRSLPASLITKSTAAPAAATIPGAIAVHREHGFGNDENPSRLGGLENVLELLEILVRVNANGRTALPCAVDDAGVVELVENDHVALAHQRRDRAGIRGVAGTEDDRG